MATPQDQDHSHRALLSLAVANNRADQRTQALLLFARPRQAVCQGHFLSSRPDRLTAQLVAATREVAGLCRAPIKRQGGELRSYIESMRISEGRAWSLGILAWNVWHLKILVLPRGECICFDFHILGSYLIRRPLEKVRWPLSISRYDLISFAGGVQARKRTRCQPRPSRISIWLTGTSMHSEVRMSPAAEP